MSIKENTVSALKQISGNNVKFIDKGSKHTILFVGNSITWHAPKSDIGWENSWGMAASKMENDYVHVTVKLLEEQLGEINYCILNCSTWESFYYKEEELEKNFSAVKGLNADIVVIRLGENMWSASEHFSSDPIPPHYAKMIEYITANAPATIIITDLFWRNETIDNAIHTVAKEKGYRLVSLGDLGDSEENMAIGQFWHKGVSLHPNDQGMRKIAERISEQILKNYTPKN